MKLELSKNNAKILEKLLCRGCEVVLAGMSSEYCEDNEEEFKENYGFTFNSAKKAITALQIELQLAEKNG